MTMDQWDVLGTLISVILFLTMGFPKIWNWWKYRDNEDEEIAKKANCDFRDGLIVTIISVVVFLICIFVVQSDKVIISEKTPISETTERNLLAETQDVSETISSSTYKDNYVYPDGNIYTGNVNNAGEPDGEGKMIYIKGDTYDGEWKDGVRNGYGIYTWNGGAKYEGNYVNGVREGNGKYLNYVDPDGRFSGDYHGEFKNNQFEGEGVFYFTNGEKFMGIFKANQRWNGTQYNADGEVLWEIENGEPMP